MGFDIQNPRSTPVLSFDWSAKGEYVYPLRNAIFSSLASAIFSSCLVFFDPEWFRAKARLRKLADAALIRNHAPKVASRYPPAERVVRCRADQLLIFMCKMRSRFVSMPLAAL